MRRSLGTALWSLVGLLSCFLGALSALLGTVPGRSLLTRAFSGTLAQAVAGRIDIGDIGGSLLTGMRLYNVRLYDHDSSIVAWLPEAEFEYNPFDFAAGRAVLHEVRLESPQFNLVQHVNGRLNLEELLRLGLRDTTDRRPRGPAPLILLRLRTRKSRARGITAASYMMTPTIDLAPHTRVAGSSSILAPRLMVPISRYLPPARSISMPSGITCGNPTKSQATSAPAPPVHLRTSATRSFRSVTSLTLMT